MSARLRQAARALINELAEVVDIETESSVGRLRSALYHEDSRLLDLEPSVVSDRDARIATLLHALRQFKKVGPHFVGCEGDKTGRCSPVCIAAQAALDHRTMVIERSVTDTLRAELDAAVREQRRLAALLRHERGYFRRVLRRAETETGFVMRSPGRPKKPTGGVRSDVAAGNTGCPGL